MTAGQNFLPELPNGWRSGRLLEVAETRTSNIDKHSVDGQQAVRLCNYVDVYYNETITRSIDYMRASATDVQIDRFRIFRGDTLITKDSESADDIGIPAFVDYQSGDLVCGYHLAIVRPRQNLIEPKYIFWVMRSAPTLRQWTVRATGVTRVGIKAGDLARAAIPIPPRNEQRAIAEYLDRETQKIDELITEQRGLIETLRERRQAVISSFVLGVSQPRLDIDRPEVGLQWSWRSLLRSMIERVDYRGATPTKTDEGIQLVTARNVRKGWIDYQGSKEYIDPDDYGRVMHRGLPAPGDILFTMEAPLGNVALVDDPNIALAQRVIKFRVNPELAVPRFVMYEMLGQQFQAQLNRRASGSTALGIKASKLSGLSLALPSIGQQRQIVEYLDEQTARIDELIAVSEDLIALSEERRSALITAAVTGQIDVREAA